MVYYKDTLNGEVYAYESEEERNVWGPPGLVKMTDEEVSAHLGGNTTPPSYNQALSILNSEYQKDVDAFNKAFSTAYLADGPSQDTKQNTIRAQYYVRKTKYSTDYAALRAQYGV